MSVFLCFQRVQTEELDFGKHWIFRLRSYRLIYLGHYLDEKSIPKLDNLFVQKCTLENGFFGFTLDSEDHYRKCTDTCKGISDDNCHGNLNIKYHGRYNKNPIFLKDAIIIEINSVNGNFEFTVHKSYPIRL